MNLPRFWSPSLSSRIGLPDVLVSVSMVVSFVIPIVFVGALVAVG